MALSQPTPISGQAATQGIAGGNTVNIFTVPGPEGSFAVVNIYFDFSSSYTINRNSDGIHPTGILSGANFKRTLFVGSVVGFTTNSGAAYTNQTQDLIGVVLEAGDTLKLTKLDTNGIDVTVNVNGLFYKAS